MFILVYTSGAIFTATKFTDDLYTAWYDEEISHVLRVEDDGKVVEFDDDDKWIVVEEYPI